MMKTNGEWGLISNRQYEICAVVVKGPEYIALARRGWPVM